MKRINPIILLTFGLVLTKATSFFENIVLAYVYGTTALSDSFILTLTLPNVFFAVISTAIAQCYVPIYQKKYLKFEDGGRQFTFFLMIFLSILGLLISVVIYIFIPYIVNVIAPKASNEVIQLTCSLMKSMCWVSMIVFQLGVLQGYFQIIKEFFIVGIISVPLNIGLSVTLLIGVNSLSIFKIGIYISYLVQFLIFMFYASRRGLKFKKLNINKEIIDSIKQTFYMMLPLFLGGLVNDLSAIIDRAFASSYPAGVLSGMDYGNKISGIIYAVVTVPIITVFYPKITRISVDGDILMIGYKLKKVLYYIIILTFPVIIITVLFSKEISYLLFFRGSFSFKSLEITTQSLVLYTVSIIPMIIRNFFEKMFFAQANTTDPMKNTIVMLIINIIGNFILSYIFGFRGLIISTIFSFFMSVLYMYCRLCKLYNFKLLYSEYLKILKLLFAVLIIGSIATIFKLLFFQNTLNRMTICVTIFIFFGTIICLYLLVLKIFKLVSKDKVVIFFKELK